MRFIDEYRNTTLSKGLVDRIRCNSTREVRLMEFCGGHTVSIFRHGIRQLLPETVKMLSGPGCPVCVTANSDLDKAIALSQQPDVILTTFGDMLKVPGSYSSLQQAKADGADIRVVYSVRDALHLAQANRQKAVVFTGIGFETTAPTIAAAILEAEKDGTENFFVLSLQKLCPPVIKALLDRGEVKLDGIVCPGHVSAIIGSHPYEFIPRDHGIACVISGFEPLDILLCVSMLVNQVESRKPSVEIAYRRVVKPEGNRQAQKVMYEVFETCDALWRGIGVIPLSGLKLGKAYQRFDAEYNFEFDAGQPREPRGCLCGEILRGVSTPPECQLFRQVCTPEHAIGPCMVSSEGSCSAYYHYQDNTHE